MPGATEWKEGESGNSKGRPKGAKDIRKEYRTLIDSAAPRVIKKCIEMADEGNETMIRAVLDRIEPKKRECTYVSVPGFKGKDYEGKRHALDEALEEKIISVEIWEIMHKTIARTFELEEIDRRITEEELKRAKEKKCPTKPTE